MNHKLAFAVVTLIVTVLSSVIAGIPVSSNATIDQSYGTNLDTFVPPVIVDRGTVIYVTTTSNDDNGDTTNVDALIANPGPDGISLREAITVTNNVPSTYTIKFSQSLNNKTILIDYNELPQLIGGNVTISGDINEDGYPDVTIRGGVPSRFPFCGFIIFSSGNIIDSLVIQNFIVGVFFPSLDVNQTIKDNIVSNNIILDVVDGVNLISQICSDFGLANETDNIWMNTQVYGNQIIAEKCGVSMSFHNSAGNYLIHTLIFNNTIAGLPGGVGMGGISISAGSWVGSTRNEICDMLIANNSITGSPSLAGVVIGTGTGGSHSNKADNIRIIQNEINLIPYRSGEHQTYGLMDTWGILIITSDGDSDLVDPNFPLTYTENNSITNVLIQANRINNASIEGIQLSNGNSGPRPNLLSNITIVDNYLLNIGSSTGGQNAIFISGAGNRNYSSNISLNEVSNISICNNFVQSLSLARLGTPRYGVICIEGSSVNGTFNLIKNISIINNTIFDSNNIAINVKGADGNSTGNMISGIEIRNNTLGLGTSISGEQNSINIVGGLYGSSGNVVENVRIIENFDLSGSVQNGFSAIANYEGGFSNTVRNITLGYRYGLIVNQTIYPVTCYSNSSVSNLTYDQNSKSIRVSLNNFGSAPMFANVSFSKALMSDVLSVVADGATVPFSLTQNSTHFNVYTTYPNGSNIIQILETVTPTITPAPTANPTISPTINPTSNPTTNPTTQPTTNPSTNPTNTPSQTPTNSPNPSPSVPELPAVAMITLMTAILLIASVAKLRKNSAAVA